jgi:hypothetical protein
MPAAVAECRLPGSERPVRLGGEGTPTIADFAAAELGCALRMSDGSASRLIGDALDLRHRLPVIWKAAQAGRVPAYQARHIATATRQLSAARAAVVDERIAPVLGALSWGRLQTVLEAAIMQADPDSAEQRAGAAARERFVRLGRKSEQGLKLIIARATAGDAIWFKATVDRIADILGREGDTDSLDIRRSTAVGILAQPAEALQLLCHHQDDNRDGPAEPDDLDQGPANAHQALDTDPVDEPHTMSDTDCTAAYRSLQIMPPPFDPRRRGRRLWCMCIWPPKPSPPAPASPGSNRSVRSFSIGSTGCSVITARSA